MSNAPASGPRRSTAGRIRQRLAAIERSLSSPGNYPKRVGPSWLTKEELEDMEEELLAELADIESRVSGKIEDDPPVIPDWSLGDRLAKARQRAGLKQAELAAAIEEATGDPVGGAPRIARYEHDQKTPRNWVIREWARLCGVPFRWLKTGEVPSTQGKSPSRWIEKFAGESGRAIGLAS